MPAAVLVCRADSVKQPVAELWTGERRQLLALAVSLRSPPNPARDAACDTSDDDIRQLHAAGVTACQAIARESGLLITRSYTSITAVWGHPVALPGDFARAVAAARSIIAALGEGASAAIDAGEATVLADAGGLIWLPALEAARAKAESVAPVGVAIAAAAGVLAGAAKSKPGAHADMVRLDALPRLGRDLVRVLAVLGDPVEIRALPRVLAASSAALQAMVDKLTEDGLVRIEHIRRVRHLAIVEAELAVTARRTVLAGDRRALHRRYAGLLAGAPGQSATGLARVAHHAEQAGQFTAALGMLRRATSLARGSDRAGDALACIEAALALIGRGDAGIPAPLQVDVMREAAITIGAVKGNASPQVRSLCQRGIALVEQFDGEAAAAARFDLLWNLQAHDLVRGEIADATATGRKVLALAETLGRDDLVGVASRLSGLTAFMAGDLPQARACYQRTLDLGQVHGLAAGDDAMIGGIAAPFASDQIAVATVGLAWVEAVAGRTQCSNELARAAASRVAVIRRHPHTEAHVTSLLAARAHMMGDRAQALSFAKTARALARDHDFKYWETWSSMIAAANDPALDPEQACADIRAALDQYCATGARQAIPFGTILLSAALLAAGRTDEASAALDRAMPLVAAGRVSLWRSSLLGMQARVALRCSTATHASALATRSYSEARLIGADLLARQAAGVLITVASGGDDTALRAVTHALLA